MRTEADGWCPFAEQLPAPNFWAGQRGRRAVVIHIAQGNYHGTISWLSRRNAASSAHFVVARDGRIAQLISINDSAWANGLQWAKGRWWNARGQPVAPEWPDLQPGLNPNWYTISIEHEGNSDQPWPDGMRDASARLLRWIGGRCDLQFVAGRTLIGHRHIDPVGKPFCPGPHVDLAQLARLASVGATEQAAPGLQLESPICGPSSGSLDAAQRFIQRKLPAVSEYRGDVKTIMGYYWQIAPAVGVDPFLAAVQCIHETDALRSRWAARPRRNPAGLGVHAEGGLSFRSWEAAVRAHIGQLLAFALSDEQASEAQRAIMRANPRFSQITPALRGSSRQLRDLNQRWAPDPNYASKLVALAQRIAAGD